MMFNSTMKTVSVILSLSLLFGVFSVSVFSVEIVDSGKCGENLTWTLDSNGLLTVEGTGEMENYCSPWDNGAIKNIVIKKGVTSIGNDAFVFCESLEGITIPDTVTSIGNEAFFYCKDLKSVVIPESVMSIGDKAFYGSGITDITISKTVIRIGFMAFADCPDLCSIIVERGNPVYHSESNCLIKTKSKKLICGSAASVIPDNRSVTAIESAAFYNCIKLKSAVIPKGVTVIGDAAFQGCEALTVLDISNSVASIGRRAFYGCDSLVSVALPNSLESISDSMFKECRSLYEISIPESVKMIDEYAFENCYALERVNIDSLDSWCSISFAGKTANPCYYAHHIYLDGKPLDVLSLSKGITKIPEYCFVNCEDITDITIPESVTAIGKWAFNGCSGALSLTIPASVTEINENAFTDCKMLTTVYLADTVNTIHSSAFKYCTELKDIYFDGRSLNVENTNGYNRLFLNCVFHGNDHIHSFDVTEQKDKDETICKRLYQCTTCPLVIIEDCDPSLIPPNPPTSDDTDGWVLCPIDDESAMIYTEDAKEINDVVFVAQGLTVGKLLETVADDMELTDDKGAAVQSDKPLGSGMEITKPDGTKLTVVVKGDNNGDGMITSADARFALRTAVGLETPDGWQLNASLVTGGEEVTSADARAILRAAVGLDELNLF